MSTFEIMLFRYLIHESERNITKLMKTGIEANLVFFESTIASVFANIEVFEPLDGLMVEAKLQEATFETPALEFIRGHDQDNRLLALPLAKTYTHSITIRRRSQDTASHSPKTVCLA